MIIFLAGCGITFPILLPVNGTNIAESSDVSDGWRRPNRFGCFKFLKHRGKKKSIFCACICRMVVYRLGPLFKPIDLTGFVLWYLTRELLHFKILREDYLRRQDVSSQIPQRTILVTVIPKDLLTVAKLKEVFGPGVAHVCINRDYSKLQDLVDHRDECATTLEGAETDLIKRVNEIAAKQGRKSVPGHRETNLSSVYIEDGKRPHHRVGFPVIRVFFGKRVETLSGISYSRLTRFDGAELSSPVLIPRSRDKKIGQDMPSSIRRSSPSRPSSTLTVRDEPTKPGSRSDSNVLWHRDQRKSFGQIWVFRTWGGLLGLPLRPLLSPRLSSFGPFQLHGIFSEEQHILVQRTSTKLEHIEIKCHGLFCFIRRECILYPYRFSHLRKSHQ